MSQFLINFSFQGDDLMVFKTKDIADTGIIIITSPKRIDVNVSDELRDLISDIIEKSKYKIILNLKDTEYIDSSGLGSIVARISVLRSNSGDVRLAVPGKSVMNLLKLTHLNQILKTYENVEQAVASFTSE
jgi:anti-sigma B factor antagonist